MDSELCFNRLSALGWSLNFPSQLSKMSFLAPVEECQIYILTNSPFVCVSLSFRSEIRSRFFHNWHHFIRSTITISYHCTDWLKKFIPNSGTIVIFFSWSTGSSVNCKRTVRCPSEALRLLRSSVCGPLPPSSLTATRGPGDLPNHPSMGTHPVIFGSQCNRCCNLMELLFDYLTNTDPCPHPASLPPGDPPTLSKHQPASVGT